MKPLKNFDLFNKQKTQLYSWDSNTGRAYSQSGGVPAGKFQRCLSTELLKLPIVCNYASISIMDQERMHRRRKQEFLSLEYIETGCLHIRSGSSGYIAEPGDLCILRPFTNHELYHPNGFESNVYGIILKGRKLLDLIRIFGLDRVDVLSIKDAKHLKRIYSEISDTLRTQPMDETAMRKNSGLSFELLSRIADSAPASRRSPMVTEALRQMEEGLSSRLDMRSMAARFHCSLPTFNKHFEAELGSTPYQHLVKMRLSKAAELLRGSQEPIKEIALAVGYSEAQHFSSEFRSFYGVSPRDYRNWPQERDGRKSE